ncbi:MULTISPECIES: arsenate reductase ArsC [Methylotenera]|uniref:arsenate reductase ArsC n=1 Tax=Methylotenera TaxID=359407 RepID=UPI00036F98AC|nr:MULTISPECIES: arsenate reductase ArsC [Methylotenera]
MNILFLCTGNSCRSILAEATFNALAPAGMKAESAGSQPAGFVHPKSIALLISKGIATEGYFSKSWDSLPTTPDIVITVCGNAADETCPAYLGKVIRAHWGVEDPAKVTGADAGIDAAFEMTYSILRKRIEAFLKLPPALFEVENKDQLQVQLNAIGDVT